MDISLVFRGWRRNEALINKILERLREELLKYAVELKKNGADVLSFADPAGTPAILGPKYSRMLAESFLLPFLSRIDSLSDDALIVHLCPRTSALLTTLGMAEWVTLTMGRPVTYTEGCLAARGKAKFLGRSCIKNKTLLLQDGAISELRLNDPGCAR
jgi:uroporphyrinogen-III decarboxylase